MTSCNLTAYTPLESLLLFQSLKEHGIQPSSFSKVSDLLKNAPLVRDAPTFDSGRLSPDSLRELYLGLLKEEVKSELEDTSNGDRETQSGGLSPGARKRKAPSPSLPSVQDAAKHAHLVPQLVQRLYVRYRGHVTREIREDERRYDALQKEVEKIERGEWDESLRRQESASVKGQEGVQRSAPPTPLPTNGADIGESSGKDVVEGTGASSANVEIKRPPILKARSESPGVGYAPTTIDSVINHAPDGFAAVKPAPVSRPGSSSSSQPGLRTEQQSPTFDRTPLQPLLPTPRLPPLQPSGLGYHSSSPGAHQSPYAPPMSQPPRGPSQSPLSHNATLTGRSPTTPVPILPPPSGMAFATPPAHLPQHVGPQYRSHVAPPPAQYSPSQHGNLYVSAPSGERQASRALPPPPPPSQNYCQYSGPSSAYSPAQQHQPPPFYNPHHHGGIMLPPFQVAPQEPNRMHQRQISQQPVASSPSRSIAAATPSRVQAAGTFRVPSHTQPQPALSAGQQVKGLRRPPSIDMVAIASSLASMKPQSMSWKPLNPPPRMVRPRSPSIEPLSPVKGQAPRDLSSSTAVPKTTRRRTGRSTVAVESTATQEKAISEPEFMESKTGRRSTRRTRGASAAPSTVPSSTRGRTRSQSVISNLNDASVLDSESIGGRNVKPEPDTPANVPEHDGSMVSVTPSTRGRRGTLQSLQSVSTNKRKREAREASEAIERESAEPTVSSTPVRQNVIVASKNFQRMSAPIMNDIGSHKNASFFAVPVKEKQAEGYHDIIKRPQDLKSIRTAITAGNRAVIAATAQSSTIDSPTAGGSSGTPNNAREGGTVTLERTADLLPPKAIVNSAQLEKELMRMFANAVMFNPGDGGMVQDTREMSEDVQRKMGNWRMAERTGEGDRGEEEAEKGKRRKV